MDVSKVAAVSRSDLTGAVHWPRILDMVDILLGLAAKLDPFPRGMTRPAAI
jgi:hypothetical protein